MRFDLQSTTDQRANLPMSGRSFEDSATNEPCKFAYTACCSKEAIYALYDYSGLWAMCEDDEWRANYPIELIAFEVVVVSILLLAQPIDSLLPVDISLFYMSTNIPHSCVIAAIVFIRVRYTFARYKKDSRSINSQRIDIGNRLAVEPERSPAQFPEWRYRSPCSLINYFLNMLLKICATGVGQRTSAAARYCH